MKGRKRRRERKEEKRMITKVIVSFLVAVGIFVLIALEREKDYQSGGRWR